MGDHVPSVIEGSAVVGTSHWYALAGASKSMKMATSILQGRGGGGVKSAETRGIWVGGWGRGEGGAAGRHL